MKMNERRQIASILARETFPPDVSDPPFKLGVNSIEFCIPGKPVPYARSGGGKSVNRFTPEPQRKYMSVIGLYARGAMKGREPFAGPVILDVHALYIAPQAKKDKTSWKTSKPDLDNLVKLVKDSLKLIVWNDDAQVAVLLASKGYGNPSSLLVRVQSLPR